MTASLSLLPILVFFAELCVVTLSTIRIIFIARGLKGLASTLGIFEISIWLFAIGQIMQNLTDIGCYTAFVAGFTCGNFLGILIEKKLGIGNLVVNTIVKKDAGELVDDLKAAGYGVTSMDAQGALGPVQVVFTIIKRKDLDDVISIVKRFDPTAFYSVNDLRLASSGIATTTIDRPRIAQLAYRLVPTATQNS